MIASFMSKAKFIFYYFNIQARGGGSQALPCPGWSSSGHDKALTDYAFTNSLDLGPARARKVLLPGYCKPLRLRDQNATIAHALKQFYAGLSKYITRSPSNQYIATTASEPALWQTWREQTNPSQSRWDGDRPCPAGPALSNRDGPRSALWFRPRRRHGRRCDR